MIKVGGKEFGGPGDVEFCGLFYPQGDEISKHMAHRLREEPFYQSDKLHKSLAFVKRRRGCIDCGAWVGGWSRELAKTFERVVTVEASPDSARCAKKNLESFDNAVVVNAAVGDKNVAQVGAHWEKNSAQVGLRVVESGGVKIPMWKIDDLPEALDLPAVDYIKIHVNGMELKALQGAAKTMREHRPILTIVLKAAIEDYGGSADAARRFLDEELLYKPLGGEKPYEIWGPK